MIFFLAIDIALIILQSTVEYDFEAWNRTRKSKQGLENYAQFEMKEIILIVDRREAARHEQWSDLLIATKTKFMILQILLMHEKREITNSFNDKWIPIIAVFLLF